MLGMGLTLTVDDFKTVAEVPRPIVLGVVGQFTVMPLLGYGIGRVMDLPAPFAVGLILVSCCPGGTASNVVAYLARAHVALSVAMTACSTAAAVVLTPMLTQWLAGTLVEVDGWGLFVSTLQMVIVPVALGVGLNTWLHHWTRRVEDAAPVVSVVLIVLIVASILGANREAIFDVAAALLISVVVLHSLAFAVGWALGRGFGYEADVRRTISIEVGMQNSGLAVVLANRHFADPLTAVPAAISAATHCVIGSVLAGVWRANFAAPSE
jgi:BASS family bile acid:Na+ symporter